MKKLHASSLLALTLVATLTGAAGTGDTAPPHFALRASTPEAGASVPSPTEIRLWFTEEPQDGTTQIRLLEAEEAGVHVMDVAQDPDDPTAFYIELHGSMPAGTYTVSWRGMGSDGHVIRDTFQFMVTGQ